MSLLKRVRIRRGPFLIPKKNGSAFYVNNPDVSIPFMQGPSFLYSENINFQKPSNKASGPGYPEKRGTWLAMTREAEWRKDSIEGG